MAESKEQSFIRRAKSLPFVLIIRSGLANIIPILIIGAFALILQTFPVGAYQRFIARFAGGFPLTLFGTIFSATFGVLSVYMTISVSYAYMHHRSEPDVPVLGAICASLMSFFVLAGAYLPSFSLDSVGPKSMILAILAGIGASALYHAIYLVFRRRRIQLYSAGSDREFNQMLGTIVPLALTSVIFAVMNGAIVYAFRVDSFRSLLAVAFDRPFSAIVGGFWKGFFFVFLSSLLWFFGIHGSDALESVMQTWFAPGLAANQAAVSVGAAPTNILTKQFFDCFVLIGGCGTTLCLLIAILLFSRDRARRGLGLAAAFPMLFNINELMVFGLPIIFNPVLLFPFIAVPLANYTVSYLALSAGLVPMITTEIEWTTPVLLGGYYATGSLAGSALQLVNVALGILIYSPFVRLMDRQTEEKHRAEYDSFMDYFRKSEQDLAGVRLIEQKSVYGEFAKALCADLEHDLDSSVVLAYQPQFRSDGQCVGVEALLRWKHPSFGMLYPPVVVKLAEDGGFLPELEEAVLLRALTDRPLLLRRFGEGIKLSVNVTATTVVTPRYLHFCQRLNAKDAFAGKNICLEVTEQAALSFDVKTVQALRSFREMGLQLAIDDFSMGQTSLNYLKENLFDFIKLDGSLVKGLFSHQNCEEIISSITQLAANLHLTVLAEYVETERQRDALHEIGCDCYQGYLYSPAVFLAEADAPK